MSDQDLDQLLDGIQSDVDADGLGDDDEISFDFTDAGKGVDFKVGAPHGFRPAVIRNVKPGVSQGGKGSPKVVFEFQFLEPSAWRGKVVFLHSPASGAMSQKGKQVLEAVGIEVNPEDPQLRFKRSAVIGEHVIVESAPQPKKPQYDEVLNVFPAGSRDLEEPDPSELADEE